jgi:hypothetical protein
VNAASIRQITVLLAAVHPADSALLLQEIPKHLQTEVDRWVPMWRRRFAAIGYPRVRDLLAGSREPAVLATSHVSAAVSTNSPSLAADDVSEKVLATALRDVPAWLDSSVRSALTDPVRARKITPATQALLMRVVQSMAGDVGVQRVVETG